MDRRGVTWSEEPVPPAGRSGMQEMAPDAENGLDTREAVRPDTLEPASRNAVAEGNVGAVYWLAAGLASVAAGGSVWLSTLPAIDSRFIVLVALAVGFGVADLSPVRRDFGSEAQAFPFTTVPLVAGLFYLSPLGLMAAAITGVLAANLVRRRRRSAMKTVVNAVVLWLGTVAALTVFELLVPPPGHTGRLWFAAMIAAIVSAVLQALAVSAAISVYTRLHQPLVLGSLVVGDIVATVADASLAIAAVTLLEVELLAAIPMSVLAGVLLFSHLTHSALRTRHQGLIDLHDFAQSMSAAVVDDSVDRILLERVRALLHVEEAWLIADTPDGLISVNGPDRTFALPWHHQARAAAHHRGGVAVSRVDRGSDLANGHRDEVLCAPLSHYGCRATIIVAGRVGGVRFRAEDIAVFKAVVGQLSICLENSRLVRQLREEAVLRERHALQDTLTSLPNRWSFHREIEARIKAGGCFSVVLLGLDRFKEVNETLGHDHGDLLLREVAQRLTTALHPGEPLARVGGDEFGVLLPDTLRRSAVHVAEHIRSLLSKPFVLADIALDISASVGIAASPDDGTDATLLLKRADIAMQAAKTEQTGVELYQHDRDGKSPVRLALVGELRRAVHENALEVWYQPQVDLRTGNVTGAEALVRWRHASRGLVPPDEFIPLAERAGLIRPLTSIVLERAVADCRRWRRGGHDFRVAVNISARTLCDEGFDDFVVGILRRHDMPATALCLEVTETTVMSDPRQSLPTLQRLHALGVTLAVDDFGTGHSTLAYLAQLPLRELKIDRSFVTAMEHGGASRDIVDAIIGLAARLKLLVVAEGIETMAAAERLTALGCDMGQGYLFARPTSSVDFDAVVSRAVETATEVARRSIVGSASRQPGVVTRSRMVSEGG